VSDLIAFLSARLDERAKASQGAGVVAWLTYRDAQDGMNYTTVAALNLETVDGDLVKAPWCACGELLPKPSSVTVIYDERTVRADIAADRKLIAAYEKTLNEPLPEPEDAASWRLALEYALALRAAVYSDHPGYREEWMPGQ